MESDLVKTVTIEWIRHGEACTNLFENFAEDEYLDLETIEYQEFNPSTKKSEIVTKRVSQKYLDDKELLMENPKYSEVFEILNAEPNSFINNDIFQIKELFKSYAKIKFKGENLNIENSKIDNATYNDLILQIDYQKFRRELLKEEEEQYKNIVNENRIKSYITLLQKMFYAAFTSKTTTSYKVDEKDKKLYDVTKMSNYNIDTTKQFESENKLAKKKSETKMPGSWLFIPTLSYVGYEQSKSVGETYLSPKIDDYDMIISSATVRTIMTSIISVYSALKQKVKSDKSSYKFKNINKTGTSDPTVPTATIYIMPYINEEYNGANMIDSDFANSAIPKELIELFISIIMNWIKSKDGFLDVEEYIKIDISHYVNILSINMFNESSIDLFIKDIIPKIINNKTKTTSKSILAYTHGNFINARRQKAKYVNDTNNPDFNNYEADIFNPFPNNLSTWIETFQYNNQNKIYETKDITRYLVTYENQDKTQTPACRGSTIRKDLKINPIEELYNLKTDNFGSLDINKLRGNINSEWFKWLETNTRNPITKFNDETNFKQRASDLFTNWLKSKFGEAWLKTPIGQTWFKKTKELKELNTETSVGGFHKTNKKKFLRKQLSKKDFNKSQSKNSFKKSKKNKKSKKKST